MAKKRKRKRVGQSESHLERTFILYWTQQYPESIPIREYKFTKKREWRFDFCWPMQKIAVEIQGMGPGHYSLDGMTSDYDKLLDALERNWKVIYLTSTHISPRRIQETCTRIGAFLNLPPIKGMETYIPMYKRKSHGPS